MQSETALFEADVKARSDALDVTRSFIVQAPAGSGKTELLIQRYLKLLAIVRHPEEVLAITFTRKAALEMQLRVINALRKARDSIALESAHEQRTISIAAEVLAKDGEHSWHLIESPGRMRIETVDAFGAGIARSLPTISGLGGIGATKADAEMATIYRDAATATLDYLATNEIGATVVERVLVHLDNNIGLYIAYIARMLASREQWLSMTGSGSGTQASSNVARQRLECNIADVIDRHLARTDSLLPADIRERLPGLLEYAANNLLQDGKPDHSLATFAVCQRLPAPEAGRRCEWIAIADVLLTQAGDWRKRITKNEGFPAKDAGQKKLLADLIENQRDNQSLRDALHRSRALPPPHYSDEQWTVLLALFDLLPLAVAELRRLFSERGVTDHNEVALAAGRALGSSDHPGEVALMLDYQVKHMLIDEMQDTSISQYELLRSLTAGWTPGDGRTVFCVGDPMQSVYRFRDAEVGEFLLARRNGIGDVDLHSLLLRRNFRSGENLVHWFNTVFLQVMPLQDDISVGAISYSESVPVEEKAGQGSHRVHPLFDADAGAEAKYSLGVIRQCLADSEDETVAVLVRSRTQLTGLLPLLRQSAIEYKAVEIDRLTDLPEVIDLLALTRALCHEGDRLAWLGVLRGPWVGLCWSDLHALVRNAVDSTVPTLCHDAQRIAMLSEDGAGRLRRFLALIAAFTGRNTSARLRDTIEQCWFALGGPALLQNAEQLDNVYRYLDVISRIETAGTLQDVRELERRLDDERVSSTVSNACRLQIMTMHKAKGLQFDHVVLHGLGRMTRGGDRAVLSWLSVPDENGQTDMIISPVGPRSELENDPLHRFIEATEKEKNTLEMERLLYVACTRAKKSLHLIGNVGVAADGQACNRPDSRSLLHRLWPAIQHEYERAFEEWLDSRPPQPDAGDAGGERFVLPELRRFRDAWQPPVPMALPGSAADDDGAHADTESRVEFYWVGSAARHAGTIVHRWLQRFSSGRLTVDATALPSLRSTSERWARDLGVPAEQLEPVARRAEKALAGILGDRKGRWILQGPGLSELPVTGIFAGRKETVVIDRVRIDDDGTHWIVDYKTSTHEGGDLDTFLAQEADRYRPQLTKYAALYASLSNENVRAALYFPLLQQFREVTIDN